MRKELRGIEDNVRQHNYFMRKEDYEVHTLTFVEDNVGQQVYHTKQGTKRSVDVDNMVCLREGIMVSGRQIQSCHVESSDQEVGKKDTLKDLTSGADVLGLCIIEARANKAQAKNGLKEVVELT